jgi:flavin reductase (DIM6/NTAB) family NADH-FMN oxidoreductase RutF
MKIREFRTDIFNLFDQHWALVTAGTREHFNSMTISWGSLGTIWGSPGSGRPIVTVYINPLRYTYGILNESDRFTVSFFPEENKKELLILGSRSGRDGDKTALTDLTPMENNGFITYQEALYTFECRKLFQQTLDKKAIPQDIAEMFYAPDEEAHRMYIGEVVRILEKEEN